MAKIEDLEPKLRKLIPMLGSDNSGEASNAARLITNILKASKLDWHEVVKKLFEKPSSAGSYYQNHQHKEPENKKRYKTASEEYDNLCFWEEKSNGNFTGIIFGRSCTVFKSKINPDLWDGVINEFGGKTIWVRGYKTAKAAQDFIKFKLDPDAKDEW